MKTAEVKTGTKWSIDTSHSEVGFRMKNLLLENIQGTFKDFGATIYTNGIDFMTSDIDFWIDPESIDTGDENRDAQIRGENFFDIKNHREISFKGRTYEKVSDSKRYLLYGELTLKGITNLIKLDIEFVGEMRDPRGDHRIGFYIDGRLNRKDWDLNRNSHSGGVWVSDEIRIHSKFQLIEEEEYLK